MDRLRRITKSTRRMSRMAQESLLNWFWVVIFIAAVIYLQVLLGDMRNQTQQLSDERRRFQDQIEEVQKGNRQLNEEWKASAQKIIDQLREAQFEYRYELFYAPRGEERER